MSSRGRALEAGWERGIPESIWPEAMLTAIRQDIRALGCPRVLSTIQSWRETAAGPADTTAQLDALRFLEELGEALFPEPEDVPERATVEAWQLPPKPRPRRGSSHALGETVLTAHPATLGPDEHPTQAFLLVDPPPSLADPDRPGASVPPKPTARKAAGEPTRHPERPGTGPEQRRPAEGARAPGTQGDPDAIRLRQGRWSREKPKVDDLDLELAPPRKRETSPSERTRIAHGGPTSRASSAPRPRASMHHVHSLYGILLPFARELVPLAYERRSRRFWARWREVAGNRGVRRPFVEDLLRTASSARSIVCELIAEMQSVDTGSVYALVDQLERHTPDTGRAANASPANRTVPSGHTALPDGDAVGEKEPP